MPELVIDADIRGILHAHTDRSDGVDTLEMMAEATRARGYQYFGVADHSKSAHYAGGLSVEEIAEQHAEVDRLNKKYGRAFASSKASSPTSSRMARSIILTRCWRFDFVVASVHGRFKLDRKTQTQRIIRAVANPYTTILGHMTGRQLLRRPGYEIDIEKVLAACAEHGVAVEINANPWRLDLDWRWHRDGAAARLHDEHQSGRAFDPRNRSHTLGCRDGAQRRRAQGPVLNCLDKDEFAEHLERRRARRRGKAAPSRRRVMSPWPAGPAAPKRATFRSPRKSAAC